MATTLRFPPSGNAQIDEWKSAVNSATDDRSTVWLWCGKYPHLGEDEVMITDNVRAGQRGLKCWRVSQAHKRPGISAEAMAWAEEQGLEFFARINTDHHVGALIRARNPQEEVLIKLRWW